jgi:2-C-methyl-D-erythritol 2,4-cyclodiphosphate synthase
MNEGQSIFNTEMNPQNTMNDVNPAASHAGLVAKPALPALRIGEGWDVHALVPGRRLILGGVQLEHPMGLLGHSDADALLHAITDAVLGAAGLGDIGRHFSDTDPQFSGADSRVLLAEAMARVRAAGWELVNLDCTVVAQAPKLAPHIPAMCHRIAQALGIGVGQVNVKAKTAEKLGPVGQGLSIEARAVVLLYQA